MMGIQEVHQIQQGLAIIKKSELKNGTWAASTSSSYGYMWFRDTLYIARTYLYRSCNTYERAIQGLLDILIEYEWKLDSMPQKDSEFPHIRYNKITFKEVDTEWGHVQFDAYGGLLFAIGEGEKRGKKIIRNEKDREVIQKLVGFVERTKYYEIECSGTWEEQRELRSSSIAAVVAGLEAVSNHVYVPAGLISEGYKALYNLYPRETPTRDVDMFQLTLIYPYNLVPKPMAQKIIAQVEDNLLQDKGVNRYKRDTYYSTKEKEFGRHREPEFYDKTEAQWVFGLSFLALAHMSIGDFEKGKHYIEHTERLTLEDGRIPELYYAGDYLDKNGNNYNENTPLIWAQAMHIQAVEMYLKGVIA